MAQRWRMLLAAAVLTSLAACDDGSATRPDESEGPAEDATLPSADGAVAGGDTTEPSAGEATAPDASLPLMAIEDALDYEWAPVQIGAGGFVTGLVFGGPPDASVMFARTDVGGAYRWDPGAGQWRQLILASSLLGDTLRASDYRVLSMASAPSDAAVVYVAVGDDFDPDPEDADVSRTGRILRSTDQGATWTASTHPFFIGGNQRFRTATERLAVHPTEPDRIFFGTQREGLWRSDDGGATWGPVAVGVGSAAAADGAADLSEGEQAGVNLVSYATAPDGTVLLVAGVSDEGVFVSADDGGTWTELVALADGEVPASATQSGSTFVFAVHALAGGTARMFRFDLAEPGAVTEIVGPAEVTTWNVALDPFDPLHLVLTTDAVSDGRWWTSRDGGTTWTVHDVAIESPEIPWLERTDLESFMSFGRFVFDPVVPGRLWFAEGMAVWRTDDTDAAVVTLRSSALGIEETVVSGIAPLPDGSAVVTVADRQGFRVIDGAFPQQTLVDERFASGSMAAASAGDPRVVAWVGAESNLATEPDRAERGAVSTDGGLTFTEMGGVVDAMYGGEVAVSTTDPATIVWLPSHPIDPAAFETDPAGLFVSTDTGSSWTNVSVDGADAGFHRLFWWFTRRALAADQVSGAFYLVSDEERFFVSEDGAMTWREATHAPPCTVDSECHVVGQLRAVPGREGHLVASVGHGGLYRTDDAGASAWTAIAGFSDVGPFDFGAPLTPGGSPTMFVWGVREGDGGPALWRSEDDGESWVFITRYPNDMAAGVTNVAADDVTPGRVYVGFPGAGAVVGVPSGGR